MTIFTDGSLLYIQHNDGTLEEDVTPVLSEAEGAKFYFNTDLNTIWHGLADSVVCLESKADGSLVLSPSRCIRRPFLIQNFAVHETTSAFICCFIRRSSRITIYCRDADQRE